MSHGYSGRGLINYFINKKQTTLYIQFNLLILLMSISIDSIPYGILSMVFHNCCY